MKLKYFYNSYSQSYLKLNNSNKYDSYHELYLKLNEESNNWKEKQNILSSPSIYHYTGPEKPWKYY
ncbi:MAG: hypothetical protein K2L64_01785, partial [Ureaplasma sp.]|nr:hypothetical protein [Ureaplasma sp.]